MEKETLEKMREEAVIAIADLSGDDKKRARVIEYIFAVEFDRCEARRDLEYLRASHARGERQEAVVALSDSNLQRASTASEQHRVGNVKELRNPRATIVPSPAEVHAKAQALLGGAGVKEGDLVGGLQWDYARRGHDVAPGKVESQHQYLTDVTHKSYHECVSEFVGEREKNMQKRDDVFTPALAQARCEWQRDAAWRLVQRIVGRLAKDSPAA